VRNKGFMQIAFIAE